MIPYFKENDFDTGMINGYKAFYEEVAKEYHFAAQVKPVERGAAVSSKTAASGAESEDDIYLTIAAPVFLIKAIAAIVVFFLKLETMKRRVALFAVLELMTAVVTVCSFLHGAGGGAFILLLFGTIFNVIAVAFPLPYKADPNDVSTRDGRYERDDDYYDRKARSSYYFALTFFALL